MDISECISTQDFIRIVGVSQTTVLKWRRLGIGPRPAKIGGRFLYSEAATLQFAAERLAKQHERDNKHALRVKDSPKLRQRLSGGIVRASVRGCVSLVDAKEIAKRLGFKSLADMDGAGIDSLVAELNKLAAQRPRPTEIEFWKSPAKKSPRVATAGAK